MKIMLTIRTTEGMELTSMHSMEDLKDNDPVVHSLLSGGNIRKVTLEGMAGTKTSYEIKGPLG